MTSANVSLRIISRCQYCLGINISATVTSDTEVLYTQLVSSGGLLIFIPLRCPWHYPISPKNRKTSCRPCYIWLQIGSVSKKDPFRIWFYPQ